MQRPPLAWLRTPILGLGLLTACGAESSEPPLSVKVMYPYPGFGDDSFADSVYAGTRQAKVTTDFVATSAAPATAADATEVFHSWISFPANKESSSFW